ncbi:MAG: hypothetical protein JWO12_2102 [Frankiales bacterium]|nr:hypothetical protein [Frankiales bacterium]
MMSVMPLSPSAEEAAKKAGALWVGDALVWHVWHDGSAWLVCGGLEQDSPGTGPARVTVRAAAGVFTWDAVVTEEPWSPEVLSLLHDSRQGPPDGEAQPQRWARESVLLRISPAP